MRPPSTTTVLGIAVSLLLVMAYLLFRQFVSNTDNMAALGDPCELVSDQVLTYMHGKLYLCMCGEAQQVEEPCHIFDRRARH